MAIVAWPRRSWTTRACRPLFDGERRPGVAEPVEGQGRHLVSVNPPQERGAHSIRPEPAAARLVEDQTTVVEVRADEEALLAHVLTM
jgi:hypothetical protein